MSDLDVRALNASFQNWMTERAAGLSQSKAFERFVFEQVLKDYDPSDEDFEVGDLGGGDDGGADGMFLYIGGQLIGDETPVPVGATDVVLHIVQAKYEDSFKETAMGKLANFTRDLLAYDKPVEELLYLNSKAKDAIRNFRAKYEKMLGRPHKIVMLIHYACIATEIPSSTDKVVIRAESIKQHVKSVISLAEVEFSPWSAGTLLRSARSLPYSSIVVPYTKVFSTADQSTVCLVKLPDFFKHVLTREDGSLQTRFLEPNVRDYQGRSNAVNSAIRTTLENPITGEDFWWLNNGVTIVATKCGVAGDQVEVHDPEIVNGLQTSHEVFNYYQGRPSIRDDRQILLRIIVSPDDQHRNRIIKATNSQTKVSELSLLSTEPIQQTIEDRLKLHGLYYDRKKGQCRRLKVPISKTISMKAMAQAVIAIALRAPDQARGRPESYLKDKIPGTDKEQATRVFNPDYDGDLFVSCIALDRKITDYLAVREDLTSDARRELRYYMGMVVISLLLELRAPDARDVANAYAKVHALSPDLLAEACEEVLGIYTALGGTDQVAKNSKMTEAVERRIVVLLP